MKLLSCYIENFGKLHHYSLDFSDGLNTICQDNGWGKSTLAVFIKVMFYGFDGNAKRDILANERKRFKPWQGGQYGGTLTFETADKRYRITRTFGEKESQDDFELRNVTTNLISSDYSSQIGEELFKINSDSFYRSIFIGQTKNQGGAWTTGDIHAKIGNLTDNTDDINHYESAEKRLKSVINQLSPDRRTGSLYQRQDEITELKRKVQEGNSLSRVIAEKENRLAEKQQERASLIAQRESLEEQQTTVTQWQKVVAQRNEWDRLKKERNEEESRFREVSSFFPADIPSMNDVNQQMERLGLMTREKERRSVYSFSDEETNELFLLKDIFQEDMPSVSEAQQWIEQEKQLRVLAEEYEQEKLSRTEESQLKRLGEIFSGDVPDIGVMLEQWNRRNNIKSALSSKQAILAALQVSPSGTSSDSKGLSWVLIGLGIVVMILGFAGLVLVSPFVGIAAFILGTVLVLLGALIPFGNQSQQAPVIPEELTRLQSEIDKDMAFIQQTDAQIGSFLISHGKSFDEVRVSFDLQDLYHQYTVFQQLEEKAKRAQASQKPAQINTIGTAIHGFLKKYKSDRMDRSLSDNLNTVKSAITRYHSLEEKESHYMQAEQAYQTKYSQIDSFLQQYGWKAEDDLYFQLQNIKDHLNEYQRVQQRYQRTDEELKQFEADWEDKPLDEMPKEELPPLDEINNNLKMLNERLEGVSQTINLTESEIEQLYDWLDEWEKNKCELAQRIETQEAEQRRFDYAVKAKEYLERAKESMTAKYSDPIYSGFKNYYEMLTRDEASRFHVNANVEVTVEEEGKQRETRTLSTGYQDMIEFCIRLSLVDAMYQDESPMLVMDDPFAHLDDQKVEAAKDFLQEISHKYQIIYFTCSSSRV